MFFFFAFDDETARTAENIPEKTDSPQTVFTENKNLCPYRIPKIEDIVKDIDSASRCVDKFKFVSDLFECGAIAISNQVDFKQRDSREKRYLQIIKSYKKDERQKLAEIFAKIYALLASVVYDDGRFNDNLGELFMHCNLGSKVTGQFFTPYHISSFMAAVSLDECTIKQKQADSEIITVCDPCCGGGGMPIAALDILKNTYGVNYAANCFIDCSDIDIRCVHMTYLQLSLAGAAAVVRHQDSLTKEQWSVWYTPALLFQYPRFARFL